MNSLPVHASAGGSVEILFPLEGMENASKKIAEVYKMKDAEDKFESRFFDLPHMFSKDMQEVALKWMTNFL